MADETLPDEIETLPDARRCEGACCEKTTWVIDCHCCEGTGEWEDGTDCATCGGVGEVHVLRPSGPREGLEARPDADKETPRPCPYCGGKAGLHRIDADCPYDGHVETP